MHRVWPRLPCRWRSLLHVGSPRRRTALAELAAYAGPDRTQRLIDGAKKENALTIYSSMTVADMGALINAFQAKYGIKAQHWRGSSEDIRNRVTREYAAGRYDVDSPRPPAPTWKRWCASSCCRRSRRRSPRS